MPRVLLFIALCDVPGRRNEERIHHTMIAGAGELDELDDGKFRCHGCISGRIREKDNCLGSVRRRRYGAEDEAEAKRS